MSISSPTFHEIRCQNLSPFDERERENNASTNCGIKHGALWLQYLTAWSANCADAMLLVTPYYNKATQKGLIASFTAVADVSTKPCILYNVPGRTGCNILPATVAALAEHPNIVAIKEASGNISQVAEIAALCGDKIDIYSGNDAAALPHS